MLRLPSVTRRWTALPLPLSTKIKSTVRREKLTRRPEDGIQRFYEKHIFIYSHINCFLILIRTSPVRIERLRPFVLREEGRRRPLKGCFRWFSQEILADVYLSGCHCFVLCLNREIRGVITLKTRLGKHCLQERPREGIATPPRYYHFPYATEFLFIFIATRRLNVKSCM